MRIFFFMLACFPLLLSAQIKIAVKAGLNFANVSNTAGINADNRTGYMLGGYIAPKPKGFFGFRSEIILSRQGYDYKSNTNTGHVNLDYLLLPQLFTLNFTKKVNIHAGPQIGFLLNAAVDSSGNSGGSLLNYFNKFTYGVAAGGEVSPLFGLFFGARVNVGLNNTNNGTDPGSPNFIPRVNMKNNVVQVYMGWRL
ncbi:MAG: PorT family protein [Chitinophagaceae bacterium]|nr:PorT family protein [Chitinophagaceae bacterium]